MAGFLFRPNRVPAFQRLFARHDNRRLWFKTPRSPYLVYPYFALTGVTLAGSMYMMGRMTMGHKTWFSKE